jgi:hypothetical protein
MAKHIHRIPDNDKSGLKKIITLSDDDALKLIQILDQAPTTINVRSFNQNIVSRIDFLEEKDARNIINTLGSLYQVRLDLGLPIDEFVEEIVEVMSESGEDFVDLLNEHIDIFRERFSKLLNVKSLSQRTKTASLIVDHQIVFKHAKIISDIRPVFGDDIEQSPVGAVLVHNLKIEYVENDELKYLHFALDDEDITSLIGILKRAQSKSETLKAFIKSSGLANYEIE